MFALKHAYLIIAHNEFEVLKLLVSALDDERNDIYIHFDKKVKSLPYIKTTHSNLYVLQKRIDVRWGSVRQIEVELQLFGVASEKCQYDFYHLISGTHLPIKTLDQIIDFYEQHSHQEIMRLYDYDAKDVLNKLSTFHFLIDWYNSDIHLIRSIVQKIWHYNLTLQRFLGVKRHKETMFHKADNWLTLSHEAVTYLVENRKRIIKKYSYSFCADEYFVPTELFACGERFHIVNCQNLLFVKFKGANAETLNLEDLETIKEQNFLFARKFSEERPETLNYVRDLI